MKEMKAYANLHGYLQQRREGLRAKGAARVRGPRVMIVGPADTGAFPACARAGVRSLHVLALVCMHAPARHARMSYS